MEAEGKNVVEVYLRKRIKLKSQLTTLCQIWKLFIHEIDLGCEKGDKFQKLYSFI